MEIPVFVSQYIVIMSRTSIAGEGPRVSEKRRGGSFRNYTCRGLSILTTPGRRSSESVKYTVCGRLTPSRRPNRLRRAA